MSEARLTVLDQLDQLEEIVLEGSRVPFTGGRLVNEGEAVDVLDAVREVLPKELERADTVLHHDPLDAEYVSVKQKLLGRLQFSKIPSLACALL